MAKDVVGQADHAAPEEDPSRPQPVLTAARSAADVQQLITAVGGLLVVAGLFTEGAVQTWALAVGTAVAAIATFTARYIPVAKALLASYRVTPLESPRTADGEALVPISQAMGDPE